MKPPPLSDEAQHLAVQQVLPWHAAGTLSATEQAMVARHLETCAACRADLALQRQIRLAEPAGPEGLDAEAALARLMPQLDRVVQEPAPLSAALRGAAPAGVPAPPGLPEAAAADGVAGGWIDPAGDAPERTGTPMAAAGAADAAARSRLAPAAGARAEPRPAPVPWRGWLRRLVDSFGGGGWRNWALAAQCVVIAGLGVLLWPAVGGQDAAAPAYRALGSGAVAAPDVVVMFQPEARLEQVQRVLQASGARIVDGPTVTGAYLVDVEAARMPQLLAALRADPAVRLAEPLGAGAAP